MMRVLCSLAALAIAGPALGQSPFVVGGAAAAPVASMADAYGAGLGVRASLDLKPASAFGWRIGLEATRFGGRERRLGTPYADGLSVGATVSARLRLRGGATAAYGLAGLGAFHERAGDHAPYAVVPEAHLGVGLEIPAGSVALVPEVRAQAVLSDLLSGSSFTPSLRVPVSLGVRF